VAYFETEDLLIPYCKVRGIRRSGSKMYAYIGDDNPFVLPLETALDKYKEWLNGQG